MTDLKKVHLKKSWECPTRTVQCKENTRCSYCSTGVCIHVLHSTVFVNPVGWKPEWAQHVFWGLTDHCCSSEDYDLECSSVINWEPVQYPLNIVRDKNSRRLAKTMQQSWQHMEAKELGTSTGLQGRHCNNLITLRDPLKRKCHERRAFKRSLKIPN